MAVPIPNELPPDRLRNRAHVLQNIGTDFMLAGQWELAVSYMRAAIALYPCPSFSNNLITALGNLRRPSVLSDYCDALNLKDIATHIVLACQPKSGSTFLRNVLVEVTGFRDLYLCHHTELASQDLFYPVLLEYAVKPTVTHQHVRATRANVQLAEAFGIRPVVLVRNLYDVIVSLRDFFSDGAVHGTLLDTDEWMRSTPERQADLLIDLVVPWHLEFLAGWQRVAAEKRLPVMWMTYEEMVADKPAAVRNVLSFQGLGTTNERIEAALRKVESQPVRNRFNRGISGRGNKGLSVETKGQDSETDRVLSRYQFHTLWSLKDRRHSFFGEGGGAIDFPFAVASFSRPGSFVVLRVDPFGANTRPRVSNKPAASASTARGTHA